MRKTMLAACVAAAVAGSACADVLTSWSDAGVGGLAQPSGDALTFDWGFSGDLGGSFLSGWLVRLYRDVLVDTVMSSIVGFGMGATYSPIGLTATDDVLLGSFSSSLSSGKAGTFWLETNVNGDAIAGQSVYSVIFNSSNMDDATQAVVVDATRFTMPAEGANVSYGLAAVANSWVPANVPEPSTMALMGLGVVVAAAARRIRGKKA